MGKTGQAELLLFKDVMSSVETTPSFVCTYRGKRGEGDNDVFTPPSFTRFCRRGTHLLTVWAGEVVSGGLQVVLQGLRGRVFVDTFYTSKWKEAEVREQCVGASLIQESALRANIRRQNLTFNSFSYQSTLLACYCLHPSPSCHPLSPMCTVASSLASLTYATICSSFSTGKAFKNQNHTMSHSCLKVSTLA